MDRDADRGEERSKVFHVGVETRSATSWSVFVKGTIFTVDEPVGVTVFLIEGRRVFDLAFVAD